MEPMFTTQSDFTLDEYTKLSYRMTLKPVVSLWIFTPVVMILTFFINLADSFSNTFENFHIIVAFFNGMSLASFCAVVPFTIAALIIVKLQSTKYYRCSPFTQNNSFKTFSFFEEYFEARSNDSQSRINYSMIYKVLETRNRFYIMIAPNQGYLIIKNNCSQELIRFIADLKNKKR